MADCTMPWSADETIICVIIKQLNMADNTGAVNATEERRQS